MITVAHHRMTILVGVQPCERETLKVIQNVADFFRRRLVLGGPRHDGGCVPMHRSK